MKFLIGANPLFTKVLATLVKSVEMLFIKSVIHFTKCGLQAIFCIAVLKCNRIENVAKHFRKTLKNYFIKVKLKFLLYLPMYFTF